MGRISLKYGKQEYIFADNETHWHVLVNSPNLFIDSGWCGSF